jgi:predicted house-cleaning NTP pyrophosphatase (Maf/HAM1 superfamily)
MSRQANHSTKPVPYGAQGKGALLVERIEGDFWNVVGLPLAPLRRLLETVGAPIESFWHHRTEPDYQSSTRLAG